MKLLFGLLILAASALADGPVQIKCVADIKLNDQPAIVSLSFEMERCEDAQFKGGGVVVRQIINSNTGQWAIRYFPAHRISHVSVEQWPRGDGRK